MGRGQGAVPTCFGPRQDLLTLWSQPSPITVLGHLSHLMVPGGTMAVQPLQLFLLLHQGRAMRSVHSSHPKKERDKQGWMETQAGGRSQLWQGRGCVPWGTAAV